MRLATISGVEEHGEHVVWVYQEHYARLLSYFRPQLRDAAQADACVQKTIRYLFYFMEERSWEAEAEHVPVYLMRIAGGVLCSTKLAPSKARHRNLHPAGRAVRLLDWIRLEVIPQVKERAESTQLFLKALAGNRRRRVPALRRAEAASL